MNIQRWIALLLLSTLMLGCEDDAAGCSENDDEDVGTLSIGLSDAPVDDLKEVVIEVDRITLVRSGDDVVIETFTVSDPANGIDVVEAETLQLNLLNYQGRDQLFIIDELPVPDGSYSDLQLLILDDNVNQSYVMELDDEIKELKLPSGELRLGSFSVETEESQTFTIEFDLRQAMTYNPGPDRYILKPRGIRLQDNAAASALQGDVDSSLFDTESPCDEKVDPTQGNVIYLFSGSLQDDEEDEESEDNSTSDDATDDNSAELDVDNLADVFDPEEDSDAPDNAVAPFAATVPVETGQENEWEYQFGFLPAGDYVLVFSCDAADDEPETFDDIALPLPEEQIIELTLGAGTTTLCNLPIVDGACSN